MRDSGHASPAAVAARHAASLPGARHAGRFGDGRGACAGGGWQHERDRFPAALTDDQRVILFTIRLPRIVAAVLVGSALSVSGLLFQGLFRNPLADPYMIGSSGGAVLGASLGVFLLPPVSVAGFGTTALLAFAGAVASIALVYWLARVDGRTPVVACCSRDLR